MKKSVLAVIVALVGISNVASAAVTFNDVPVGTVISSDHYQSQGLLFYTDPGQYLFTEASFGINSGFGPSLVASGNGRINVEFVDSLTLNLGTVHTSALMILDNNPGGADYTVTSFDISGQQMIQIGNNHNYLAGDGYYQDPGTHSIEFLPADPSHQFLNSVGFSQIQSVPEPTSVSLVALGACAVGLIRRRSR